MPLTDEVQLQPEMKVGQPPHVLCVEAITKATKDRLDGEVVLRIRFRKGKIQGTQVTVVDNWPQPKGASDDKG